MPITPAWGYAYALLSALSYGAMSYIVSRHSGDFPGEQTLFFRTAFGALVLLPFVWRKLSTLMTRAAITVWIRALSGGVAAVLFFYTLRRTSTANANILMGSTPLFVALFSWLLFREKLTKREVFGIAAIVVGDILLHLPSGEAALPLHVGLVGLASALTASIAYLMLGQAAQKHSPLLIIFSFCAAAAAASGLWPGETWQNISGAGEWGFLLAVAITGLISQVLMTFAFVSIRGPIVTAIGRSSILWGGFFDFALTGFRPHFWEWISYVAVIGGILFLQPLRGGAGSESR